MIRAWRASYAKMLAAVARFHRAGIQIVSGTDDVAGLLIDGDPTQDISAVAQCDFGAAERRPGERPSRLVKTDWEPNWAPAGSGSCGPGGAVI
jgi:hypothetical protein